MAFSGGFGINILGMSDSVAKDFDEGNVKTNIKNPVIGWMMAFLFMISFIGLFCVVPLRKIMILGYKLTYPTSSATAHLINSFHTPQGAMLARKQVTLLFKTFVASFSWSRFQWFYEAGKNCGFGSFPTFGLKAFRNRFQVSKVVWKMLLEKRVDLKHSKIHIYERTSSGKSDGRYMPYPKVDSFLKVCQILGLTGIDLFSPSDVVEKRDVRRVCMCIRSLSKKSRLQNLDVPDFDKVTYTIAMPTDLVGGIRRNLEQSQCSSSSSNGYIQSMDSREQYRQRSICGDHARYFDSFSESDEAESTFMEPDLESPLSNVAYDATYLSRVVRERPSDGNLVFDGHLSELQSELQLERWDGHKEGCNGLPAVLNDFYHSRAVKNNNGKLQEVDYNKSSYPEQRNNEAVSTYFGDTGFVMWPNLDSQSLIKGSFQSSALPFEDSPFHLDELAVIAEDDNGMEHKAAEEIGGGVKGIDVDVGFETQTPIGGSSTGDEGETSKPHPPVKKVLKSIAGGITLFGALFLLLHIKGKRDQEKNSRMLAPLQNRNSRSEQVEKGDSAAKLEAFISKFGRDSSSWSASRE